MEFTQVIRVLGCPARAVAVAAVFSVILLGSRIDAAGAPVQTADLSPEALKVVTPDGYKVAKVLPVGAARNGREYLVGLTDVDEKDPQRTVTVLLVVMRDRPVVEDTVLLHPQGLPGEIYRNTPNYLNAITMEKLGGGALFRVWSNESGGGSGATHYFDLFLTEGGKLHLVKSFTHGRMQRLYFTVYKGVIYDSEVQCSRGEKHGNAYVYKCYLNVTKYGYDGRTVMPVASEHLRERQGNRYLSDEYRNMSVLTALKNGEVFRQSP